MAAHQISVEFSSITICSIVVVIVVVVIIVVVIVVVVIIDVVIVVDIYYEIYCWGQKWKQTKQMKRVLVATVTRTYWAKICTRFALEIFLKVIIQNFICLLTYLFREGQIFSPSTGTFWHFNSNAFCNIFFTNEAWIGL